MGKAYLVQSLISPSSSWASIDHIRWIHVGAVGWNGNAVVTIFEGTPFEHEKEKTTRLTNARHIQRSQSHWAIQYF